MRNGLRWHKAPTAWWWVAARSAADDSTACVKVFRVLHYLLKLVPLGFTASSFRSMLLVTLADAFPVNVVTLLGESVAVNLPADTGIGACSARLLSGSVTTGTPEGERNPAGLNVGPRERSSG